MDKLHCSDGQPRPESSRILLVAAIRDEEQPLALEFRGHVNSLKAIGAPFFLPKALCRPPLDRRRRFLRARI